jgi:hypothetical protein
VARYVDASVSIDPTAGDTGTPVRPTARQGTGTTIVDALNQEWRRLEVGRHQTVATWAGRHGALAGCRSLTEVLDVVREDPDPALHALLVEVGSGDQLAGRVLLQSMLGRMVRMARRDPRAGVDDYVATLWCQISTYPLARRPVRIAANLALDTLKAVHREHRWVVRGEVSTWPPGALLDEVLESCRRRSGVQPDPGADDLDARSVLTAARDLQLLDDAASTLLASVYLEGLSGSEAAARHGTTAGSIRVRCSRAVRRLTLSAPALAEAA